jgi:hypothetical protein
MTQPYIGVTGFKSSEEIAFIQRVAEEIGLGKEKECNLMLGFLSSARKMRDPTSAGKRSPPMCELSELLRHVGNYMPAIHYAPDDAPLAAQLEAILEMPGVYERCKHVQLNTSWPDPEDMQQIQQKFPGVQYILQLPPEVLGKESAQEIGKRVREYADIASYIFIDPSRGKGVYTENFIQTYRDVYDAIASAVPDACIGVAGGLEGSNVADRIMSVRSHTTTPCFVDAEGKLMTEDSLDLEKVNPYLRNATKAWYSAFGK